MNAGSNTIDQMGAPFTREYVEERTSLLASPPIRIWLTLLLVLFGIGGLGAFTQLDHAFATLERANLLSLFTGLTAATAFFAFTVGQATRAPIARLAARTLHTDAQYGTAPFNEPASVAAAGEPEIASGSVESRADADSDEELTEYFNVEEAPTYDPLADDNPASRGYIAGVRPAASVRSATGAVSRPLAPSPGLYQRGPRWLLIIDDLLTRPVSWRTIIVTVALSSVVCALATWNWVGSIGETLTALIGVAVLSALFSRVTHMAAQSRQVVDDLRTTNNHLVQEIVGRRGRDKVSAAEIDGKQRWASALEFDNAPLTDLEALRTKFLNEVSHELRGPITAINLAARIIMKHHIYDHEVVDRFGSTIVVEGDRLAHIVNDFLELAKIESCCIRWSDDRIEPTDIVATAIYAAEPAATERNVKLVSDIEDNLRPMIADRNRIIQALTILLTTALRHTPEKATVTVHARRGEAETLFAVEDNGAGTRNEKPSSVFGGQQTRPDERDGKENCGQGLGLCIASEIATHYGGEMWVEGRVGEGSAFVLSIPDETRDSGSTSTGGGTEGDDESAKEQEQAYEEFEQSCPTPGDASQPVLTAAGLASAAPSVFEAGDSEPETADSLSPTTQSPVDGDAAEDTETTSDVALSVDTQTDVSNESKPDHHPQADTAVGALMSTETDSHSVITDSLGTVDPSQPADFTDEAPAPMTSYDPETLPWDEHYEQTSASEQLSLRELDDMMYGRAHVPTHDDSSGSSGDDEHSVAPQSGADPIDAPQESCDHASVTGERGSANEEDETQVGDSFETLLAQEAANQDNEHTIDATVTAASDDGGEQSEQFERLEQDTDSLTSALTSLGRTTAELTTEVAACEIQSSDTQSNDAAVEPIEVSAAALDTKAALDAIAAGLSSAGATDVEMADTAAAATVAPEAGSAEDHTNSVNETDSDDNLGDSAIRDHGRPTPDATHTAARAPRKEMRKPHGGWQLASRMGANLVRRTPHRR